MQEIKILNKTYKVEDHWFWKQYNNTGWEPQTLEVYRKCLTENISYIDIGTWLGVTIFYAKEIGCKDIYGVEANPLSYQLTKKNCELNNISVDLSNLAITNKNEIVSFGSTNSNETSSNSSLKGDRFQIQGITLTEYLKDKPKEDVFVKIDIEGAEELIIEELEQINGYIWLSIHPPFMENKEEFYNKIKKYKVYCNNLEERILTKEKYPSWGTKFGNFFEVLIDNRKS